MTPNRIVQQRSTCRKRKAPPVNGTARANCNSYDSENSGAGIGNICNKLLSSDCPPQSFGKLSASNKNGKTHQRSHQMYSKSEHALNGSQSINNLAWGMNEKDLLMYSGRPAPHRQDLQHNPQKHSSQQRHRSRNRCRQRYLRGMKRILPSQNHISGNGREVEILVDDVDVVVGVGVDKIVNVNDNPDNKRSRRLESQPKRRRSRKKDLNPNYVSLVSKNETGSYAEFLIQSFLEQRYEKRNISQHTLSSPFDDPVLFPALLLGVCTLCCLSEWYDERRKEAAFIHSPMVRDLIVWMKERQTKHSANSSETIVQKNRNDMNQSAKFHESIEDTHQISFPLHKEEEKLEEQQQHYLRSFKVENVAKAELKLDARHYGLNKLHGIPKSYVDMYDTTNASDDSLLQLRLQNGREEMHYQRRQRKIEEPNFKVNRFSTSSKQDEEPHKSVESTVVQQMMTNKKNNSSDIQDNTGELKALSPNILRSATQNTSVPVTTLSALPIFSDNTNRRWNINPQFDEDTRVLMPSRTGSSKDTNPPMTKPSPETNEVREKDQHSYRITEQERKPHQSNHSVSVDYSKEIQIEQENGLTDISNLPTDLAPNESGGNDPSLDRAPSITTSSNTQTKTKLNEIESVDTTTNLLISEQSRVFTGECDPTIPCPVNKIVFKNETQNQKSIGGNDESETCPNHILSIDEAKSITKGPINKSRSVYRPKSRRSCSTASKNSRRNENRNGFVAENDDDGGDGRLHCTSNNSSNVLLSQSQKDISKSRRVTASPLTLLENKGRSRREQYKHDSKTDFTGQNQNVGDRMVEQPGSDIHPGKEKSHKMNRTLKLPSLRSSQKAWMFRAPRRSPSFKQTSLTSSTGGWVSNQRARNFVKNISSPKTTAMAVVNPNIHGRNGKGNISINGAEKVEDKSEVLKTSRYEEVVRGKVARKILTGNKYEECIASFDETVLEGDDSNHYDCNELLRRSHRDHQTPNQTPDDYWELSFIDEKLGRLPEE